MLNGLGDAAPEKDQHDYMSNTSAFLPKSNGNGVSRSSRKRKTDSAFARPQVITLCGSTRFMKKFEEVNRELTLKGNVVFSVATKAHEGSANVSRQQKALLDRVHREKIRLSDEIFVIDVGGYVGPSTRQEIEYAERLGKRIRYLEGTAEASR